MPLPIETLEAFFETKFHFEQHLGQLIRFDGYAYWHLLWMPGDGQFLKIAACRDFVLDAFPVVEVEGRYSDDISVSPLSGSGFALILRPESANKCANWVTITKTKDGRFSLSTTIGEIPK